MIVFLQRLEKKILKWPLSNYFAIWYYYFHLAIKYNQNIDFHPNCSCSSSSGQSSCAYVCSANKRYIIYEYIKRLNGKIRQLAFSSLEWNDQKQHSVHNPQNKHRPVAGQKNKNISYLFYFVHFGQTFVVVGRCASGLKSFFLFVFQLLDMSFAWFYLHFTCHTGCYHNIFVASLWHASLTTYYEGIAEWAFIWFWV